MPHDVPVSSPDVQPTGRRNARMRQTVGDMVRSMAVVLAVVAVVVLVNWRPQEQAVKVVDVTSAVTLASVRADFPVRQPAGLAADWRATSARWEPTEKSAPDEVLHLGYVTPAGEYAQVTQSSHSTPAYLAEQTDGGRPVGPAAIAGAEWERWEGPDRRSLVQGADTVVTVVSGGAAWSELEQLAASLVPVGPLADPGQSTG